MRFPYWLPIAAVAALPLAALAETGALPNPADASIAVNPFPYVSAFEGYRPAAEEQETPDKSWRASNDTMQRLGGHAGHMKNAEPEDGRDPPVAMPAGKGQ